MANNRILSNIEKDFMLSSLELGLRTDGRQLDTVREMKVEFGAKTGTVEVQLGKTRILARVVHELGAPRFDKPNQGIININCKFPQYARDAITPYEIDRICLIIKAGIYESKAIDLESLCVLNGDKVWVLNCDITVIQNDGNVIDCANLACLCALKHHRRPDVTVVGSKITVHSMIDRHPISLSIHHLPICVTLAHVNLAKSKKSNFKKHRNLDGFHTLIDPCLSEEKLMNGKTVYCMTAYNQLCAIDKIGGVPMSAKSFLRFMDRFVIGTVRKWNNQIENKFIQFQLAQNDALTRKMKLNRKMLNPINVFEIEKNDSIESKESVMSGDGNDIWNDWQNKERNKLEMIQTNLKQSLSEKRISDNQSVLTSEFD